MKSNKGSYNVPPLQNEINSSDFDDIVYSDDEKCSLLNKYFSMIANLEEDNVPLPEFQNKTNFSIDNIVVNFEEIIDVIQILNPNKASGPDVISHKC